MHSPLHPPPNPEIALGSRPEIGPVSRPEISPGSQLGAYTVLARIGGGGMGEVFKARDTRLGRLVAIKTLTPGRIGDPEAQARFEREAHLLADLNHPNILAIYDVGHLEGQRYLVTEFLEGEPLSAAMLQGPMAPARVAAIAKGIALGLAAAHARGIVHRDLKPANVFLLASGAVKVLDFGLAKDLALEPWPGGLSISGALVGTLGYLSPEQAQGEAVDARTDLFNLGILMHEMLAGQSAFRGETALGSLQAVVQSQPRGSLEAAPAPLQRVVARCLEKQPEHRFQTASDLAFALEAAVSGSAPPGQAPFPLRRWGRAGLTALGLLGAVGILAALLRLPGAQAPKPDWQGPVFRPITSNAAWIPAARFSRDGRSLAFSRRGEDWRQTLSTYREGDPAPQEQDLAGKVVALGTGGELFYTDEELPQNPGAGSCGTLFSRKSRGETSRSWLEGVQEADLDATGQQMAVIRRVFKPGDPVPTSVLEYPLGHLVASGGAWFSCPRIHPDGRRIAYIRRGKVEDLPGEIVVVDTDGREQFVSAHLGSILSLAWAADGVGLLYCWNPRPGTPFRISRLDPDGQERLVLSAPQSLLLMDAAPDGRLLIFASEWDMGSSRAFLEREGRLEPLDLGARMVDYGAVSPDGSRLAYAIREADGRDAIYLRAMDGAWRVRLGPGSLALAISPDNAWVLVQRQHMRLDRGQPTQLALIPTGSGRDIPLRTDGLREVRQARFLPGSSRVLVGTGAEHAFQPLVLRPDLPPAPLPGSRPDERFFAVAGEAGVVVQAFGQAPALLTPGGERHALPRLGPGQVPVGWDALRQELILLEGPETSAGMNAWVRQREVRLWRCGLQAAATPPGLNLGPNSGMHSGPHSGLAPGLLPGRRLRGDLPYFASRLLYADLSQRAFVLDLDFRGTLFVVEGVR